MSKVRRQGIFFVLGIFLLGACMRTPITSSPSIVSNIAKTLGVQPSDLGILTTLPLVCFGLFSSIVPVISRKFGNEITIAGALAVLFIGSYLRIINVPTRFIGTLIVGIAITYINVLLPALALALSSAIGAGFSSPLAKATSWQFAIQILSLMVFVTFILWLPNLRRKAPATTAKSDTVKVHPWTNKNAWLILIYFGVSSLVFYTLVAWLPTIAIGVGISETNASLLAGLFQFVSIIPPFFVPGLAVRMTNRSPIIIAGAGATIVGVFALLFPINSIAYFIVINTILGIATATTFTLVMTLFGLKTKTPSQTTSLSGMAQSVGYLLASVGPVLTGTLKNVTGSWHASEIFIIIVSIIFMTAGVLAEKNKFVFNS